MEKNEKKEKVFWVTKRDNKGITNRGRVFGITSLGKMDYK